MVKKIKSAAATAPEVSAKHSALASSVKDSAQQIWLAGMGAFSKAQEEGTKVFEALVKEGMSLQKKTQAVAEEKLGEVTGKMSAMADTRQRQGRPELGQARSHLRTAHRQGPEQAGACPPPKDVDALVQRVDALARRGGQAVQGRAGQGCGQDRREAGRQGPGQARAQDRRLIAPGPLKPGRALRRPFVRDGT